MSGQKIIDGPKEALEHARGEAPSPDPALVEHVARAEASDRVMGALDRLVNARALSGVRAMVAGWNGDGLPDGRRYERHPARLGARIETNCGRIYELDEIMQDARAALAAMTRAPSPKITTSIVRDQASADAEIPPVLSREATVRIVVAILDGPVEFRPEWLAREIILSPRTIGFASKALRIHLVVVVKGDPAWIESIELQCLAAGVDFLVAIP